MTCAINPKIEGAAEAPRASLATLRDRVAAQSIDLMLCALLIACIAMPLAPYWLTLGISASGIDLRGGATMTTAAVLGAVTLLYFFLFEAAMGATPGKMLCRLHVRGRQGNKCGIAAAFVRTVFRPVDVLTGPVLIARSATLQRLGDRVADTTVAETREFIAPSQDGAGPAASWEKRTAASLADPGILMMFTSGYLVATNSLVYDGRFRIDLGGIPLLVLLECLVFYFIVLEALLGGTAGKLAYNIRIVRLRGGACGFVEATIRALCRLLDIATLGLLPFLLVRYTPARRHIGDRLAGTIVVASKESGKTKFRVLAAIVCITGALAAFPYLSRIGTTLWMAPTR